MRRSKSDPAKYARNYRKISQRRMTQFDGVDEEKEIERLRSVLRNSERRLGQVEEPEVELSSSKESKKRKRTKERLEKNGASSSDDPSNTVAILSEELAAELSSYGGGDGGENPLVVVPSKKKNKKDKKSSVQLSPEEIREAKAMQKNTARKLQQLEVRAAQKKKRSELYKRLEASQVVPQSQLQPLLQSSGKLSRKESSTKKQTLKKILTKERAGLLLTKDEKDMLYPEHEIDEEEDLQASQNPETTAQSREGSLVREEKADRTTKEVSAESDTEEADASKDMDLSTKANRQAEFQGHVKEKNCSTLNNSVGADFASLMMASLAELNKGTTEKSKEKAERTVNDLSVEVESSKRYIPTNPTVVMTAAKMGLRPASFNATQKRNVLEIQRPVDVEKTRFELPVTAMEFEITDAIRNNDVTIICGETGSGKSTQVPSFLYEAGMTLCGDHSDKHFLIGVTQPRRVAAVSTAKRVCYELGQGNGQSIPGSSGKGNLVAYQTRYESAGLGENTRIKFMTDGILLNEIQSDLLLRRYSVVVLDESHERNLNTDVLIGLLSVALPLRKKAAMEDPSIVPLKLILMSATLRVEDFTNNDKLFSSCPPAVVTVPGRTHPVSIHHSKVTELDDYETAAFRKVCKIHRRLPRGGILVFLTGKSEIVRMVKRLRRVLNSTGKSSPIRSDGFSDVKEKSIDANNCTFPREMDDEDFDGDDANSNEFDDNDTGFDDEVVPLSEDDGVPSYASILPLYSLLCAEEQAKVFAPVPENHRLIVVATNIAETSITIPGISYVVDTGRQKCRNYNSGTGVASYDIMWISKASADQRSGRAGRTGPGHCYRLYSSSLYSRHMDAFALPEVLTRPLEDVALAMKAMKISNISTFPFPTPPDRSQIDAAVRLLADIGCLDLANVEQDGGDGVITKLGLAVSKLPLGVRYAKMLLVAADAGVLDYAIVAVAALSETSPFLNHLPPESLVVEGEVRNDELEIDGVDKKMAEQRELQRKRAKKWYHSSGDVFAAILAIGAYTYAGKGAGGASEMLANRRFCEENGLNYTIMARIQKMRTHLARLAKRRLGAAPGIAATSGTFSHKMSPPNEVQEILLIKSIASGLLDHVAILATPGSISGEYPVDLRSAYIGCRSSTTEPLFLDRGSSTYNRDYRQLPRWICYDSVVRKIAKDGTPITVMKNVTPVSPQWLGEISKDTRMVSLGSAVGTPLPTYDFDQDKVLCSVTTKFGSQGWIISPVRMTMYDALHTQETRASPDFVPDDSFRWFARFLWEGKVIPELASLKQLMNDSPDLITKKSPSSKVNLLVRSLSAAGVDSAAALRKHWAQKDEKFLFRFLKLWVKPEHHETAKKTWIDAVRHSVKIWKEDCV